MEGEESPEAVPAQEADAQPLNTEGIEEQQEGETAAGEPEEGYGDAEEGQGEVPADSTQDGVADEGDAGAEDDEGGAEEGADEAGAADQEGDEEQLAAEGEAAESAGEAAASAAPLKPAEVELEPLPEDYVPVAMLPPLPEPFRRNEEGKPIPLEGVESLFLTGTTLDIMGLSGLSKASGITTAELPKERIIADVQFRGAISDFHPFKQKILDADYDPLVVRLNEDDIYGDGNNFEVAVLNTAVDAWAAVEAEAQRRAGLLALEAAHAAAEKRKPKARKAIKPKPWQSLGSEVDIEEASVRARREAIRMVIQRKRGEFNASYKFSDKDAHELWNSSQMECRPFKDPNFDMRRMEQDVAVQAVASTSDTGVQAGAVPLQLRPQATQYAPLDMSPEDKAALVASREVAGFLERVREQCEQALVQNEIANIFRDDLASLNDEADGVSGNRKDTLITEAQSFTHLTYSKNKVVSAIQWLPHRKGCVAVACTEAHSHTERVARGGRTANAHILVWNFKDPIHPEYVMQSPFEVFAFQFNPTNPDLVCGGCYNGQVVVWDTSTEHERITKHKPGAAGGGAAAGGAAGAAAGGAAGGGGGDAGDAGDETLIPVVRHKFMSDTQFSHHQLVGDLQWLPGVEISHRGKVTKLGDGSKECNFFATIAGDGKVNFWDVRIERLLKKGKRADDLLDLVWKPIHCVHLISLIGLDFGGTRFCFNHRALDGGQFTAGSFDGELAHAEFVRPEGEENPDYMKSCAQAHTGPVAAVERSPFFDDIILTVGDWQFQIWKEGQAAPLFQSGYAAEYYTAAVWSPTRPGVIYVSDQSGALEVWDLLDRSHEPSVRVTLAASPIMSLTFNALASANSAQQAAQQLLAVGDSTGVLRILELPRSLRRPVPNEKKVMAAFLARSEARVADVEARVPARAAALREAEERRKEAEAAALTEAAAKEAAAKDAAAAAAAGLPPPAAPSGGKGGAGGGGKGAPPVIEIDEKAEVEYLKMEHRFKVLLGLVEADVKA